MKYLEVRAINRAYKEKMGDLSNPTDEHRKIAREGGVCILFESQYLKFKESLNRTAKKPLKAQLNHATKDF